MPLKLTVTLSKYTHLQMFVHDGVYTKERGQEYDAAYLRRGTASPKILLQDNFAPLGVERKPIIFT